ncbi:signal peptidase I [Thalassotalea loyana]|uniref:Signal peptidase I n=1 Tax=Thalassotalea loyana TaxID=280483 RepID=A0ABQ6HF76_9GAMM|nr:signal peptidase I [Thalassotalea loyana]GLX85146.1 signal peptidase I [Thalassotalea loyana]
MAVKKVLKENIGLLTFLLSMAIFRSAFADYYSIPSSSMEPTLEVGDRVGVSKMAYDLRVPFTMTKIARLNEPMRGDIIVFESDAADKRLIKRVIGLPGDTVAMKNERLILNGKPVEYQNVEFGETLITATEMLPGKPHIVKFDQGMGASLGGFDPVTVPADSYLVLGDNRRASADSRVYGFVPRGEIIGRADKVLFSLDYDNYYMPKNNRLNESL